MNVVCKLQPTLHNYLALKDSALFEYIFATSLVATMDT